ncbi:MAG: hypothetical protein AB7Q81_17360 [Gammaproteobacteria bacterium]
MTTPDVARFESVRVRRPPVAASPAGAGSAVRGNFEWVGVSAALLALAACCAWPFQDDVPFGRLVFALTLLLVCVAPVVRATAHRQRILCVFLGWYYLSFGFGDLVTCFIGSDQQTLAFLRAYSGGGGLFTRGDLAILLGGACFAGGFFAWQRVFHDNRTFFARSWSPGAAITVAVITWLIGTVYSLAYYLSVTPAHIPTHLLGTPLNIVSNLRLLSLFGAVILIYLTTRKEHRGLVWTLLAIAILLEIVLGFVANTRTLSYRLMMMLIIGRFMLTGRFNLKLVAILVLSYIPYGMMFTIYRSEVLGPTGATPLQAMQTMDRTTETLATGIDESTDVVASSLRTLKDRVNTRVYVDIITARTGVDVPFQKGRTILNIAYSFVPRALWADKPVATLGQEFNRAFGLSKSSLTFVPTTQLGELYWNYGFVAVIAGMLAIGAFFGAIGNLYYSEAAFNLPRFIIILFACFFLVTRFEASLASEYGRFGRVVLILGAFGLGLRLLGQTRPRGAS